MRENQGNLTTGSVRKKLAVYALPLVLTSVLQALYSIADLVIAGQFIGKRSVSAINNSSQIMNLLTQVAVGLTLGGNILIGQYFGERQPQRKKTGRGDTLFYLSPVWGCQRRCHLSDLRYTAWNARCSRNGGIFRILTYLCRGMYFYPWI